MFTPSIEPPGFKAATRDARTRIDRIVASGHNPKSTVFGNPWSNHKSVLMDAQLNKCGYCEQNVSAGQHGDVEHYAPKSRIDRIVEERTGTDEEGRSLRHSVSTHRERGYYWRAYDWTNYVLTCSRCNYHKQCLFPVSNNADDAPDFPTPNFNIEPLLLNPFEPDLEPSDHIWFNEDGLIFDRKSTRGWATIQTCRLDRVELSERRRQVAQRVSQCCTRLAWADHLGHAHDFHRCLTELADLGDATQEFAGMVRIMIRIELELPWDDLIALARADTP